MDATFCVKWLHRGQAMEAFFRDRNSADFMYNALMQCGVLSAEQWRGNEKLRWWEIH